MNILLFGMSSYPGGIENYLVNYFCNDSFPSDKIHIDFVTYEATIAYEEKLIARGYHVCRVPHLKKNTIGYLRAIKMLMTENHYDAVYINMLTAANAIPVYLADRFGIKKIILHAHANSTIDGLVRKLLHYINRKYCNHIATLKLACSKKAGEWLFGKSEFVIIPNAIDCARFYPSCDYRFEIREKYGISQNTLLLGHIGRFATEKNHNFMVEILESLIKDGIDAKLMFVGDGYTMQEVCKKVKDNELTEKVIFVGTTVQTEKYYPSFDVFLFPSQFEGFGISLLEAQSCGLKCICSDAVSQETNVSGTVEYISLREPIAYWTDRICSDSVYRRNLLHDAVSHSKYSISTQISKLVEELNK